MPKSPFQLPLAIALAACTHGLAAPPTADAPNSGLRIIPEPHTGACTIDWWGSSNWFYFMESSTNLENWHLMPVFAAGSDDVISWGFHATAPRLFFRLLSTDDPESEIMRTDHDGDGLTAWQEYLFGSDPFNPDTSGDGIFDLIAKKLGMPATAPPPPPNDPNDTTPPIITLHRPANAVPLP